MATATKTPKTRKKAKTPLSPTLRTIALSEALGDLRALDDLYAVVPDTAKASIANHSAQILQKAHQLGIANLEALLTNQAPLLEALTSLTKVTEDHRTVVAEPLHTYRNVLAAMLAASAAANGLDHIAVLKEVDQLKARTHHVARPLTDDEILLMRVHAAIAAKANPNEVWANVYALADTGLAPIETTDTTLSAFNDPEEPTTVLAPGTAEGIASRHLPLDTFAQAILGARTRSAHADGLHPTTPLTYRPTKQQPGSSSGGASAHQVLTKRLVQVGLKNHDITAAGISHWRIRALYETHGIETAAQAHGRKKQDSTLRAIWAGNDKPTQRPAIISFVGN